jgi:arginine decarboxylase
MTQSSILNVREGLVSANRVKSVISMLTTTSTSYLLLASLDTARHQLVKHGKEMMDKVLELAAYARSEINNIPGLYCVGKEILGSAATYDMDPSKLLIQVRGIGLTGHQTEVWLREKYNIEVELSDLYNILCIVTPGDSILTVTTLVQALRELARIQLGKDSIQPLTVHLPNIPALSLSPREAFYAETEIIPLREAAGRIMAEFIMVYPPGIPIVLPGEVMTQDNIDYILENLEAGLPVQGPEDESIQTIKVIKRTQAIK